MDFALLDVSCSHAFITIYILLFIKDHLSEDSYVAIVRNQILVDVQVSGLHDANVPVCVFH